MIALAIDPGDSTGWARMADNGDLIDQGVIPNGLDGFLAWPMPEHDILVVEEFIVEPDYVGRAVASEIVGAAIARTTARVIRQLRSMKATLVRGSESQRFAWLRARGFDGMSHDLDAITHALLYFRRSGNVAVYDRYFA